MWMVFIGDLRRRWAEYALGAAAVALVVAALVTHRAVTASAEESVHELAHRLGRNMLVVPAATDLAAFHAQRYGPESLPDTFPDTIRTSHVAQHVQAIEARLYGNAEAGGRDVIVVGQDLSWPVLGDVEPALLGPESARALGVGAGGTFRLGGQVFSVLQVSTPECSCRSRRRSVSSGDPVSSPRCGSADAGAASTSRRWPARSRSSRRALAR
jgi:hypothetical protein